MANEEPKDTIQYLQWSTALYNTFLSKSAEDIKKEFPQGLDILIPIKNMPWSKVYPMKPAKYNKHLRISPHDISALNSVKWNSVLDEWKDIVKRYRPDDLDRTDKWHLPNEIAKPAVPEKTMLPLITLNEFFKQSDISDYIEKKSGSTFYITGSSKSGKTYIMLKIVNKLNNIISSEYKKPIIILMSATMSLDGSTYKELPKGTIKTSTYNKKLIATIADVQAKTNKKFPIVIVLDDVVDKKNDPELVKLFTTYRNLNISTVLCIQSTHLFNKDNRGNVNYVIAGKFNNMELADDFATTFTKGYPNAPNNGAEYMHEVTGFDKLLIDLPNNRIFKLK